MKEIIFNRNCPNNLCKKEMDIKCTCENIDEIEIRECPFCKYTFAIMFDKNIRVKLCGFTEIKSD